jgi:acetate kinase
VTFSPKECRSPQFARRNEGNAVREAILVLNSGSSSIKFAVFVRHPEPGQVGDLCEGECEGIGHNLRFTAKDGVGASLVDERRGAGATHEDALAVILHWLAEHMPGLLMVAAGHRVVHGGAIYTGPVRIDAAVISELRRLVPLAPLHQPHAIAGMAALSKLYPALPQIACFDTAFHLTQSDVATAFALPRNLSDGGIRRFGFHGLSYEYIASVLPSVIGADGAQGRVIVAHLGGGASMCGMHHGRSVACTTGFTSLDGLMMARRCGSLDPGVVLYLMLEKGMSAEAVSDLLYNASGLLGVSGFSDDMEELLASRSPHAVEAVDLFIHRIGRELGSLAAALGGFDALVFTAGIGEHAPEIRQRVCKQAEWLGLDIDEASNAAGGPKITANGGKASAWVVPTNENLMVARHIRAILDPSPRPIAIAPSSGRGIIGTDSVHEHSSRVSWAGPQPPSQAREFLRRDD